MKVISVLFWIVLVSSVQAVFAQDSGIEVPDTVKPFVGPGKTAIGLESADLNGDGFKDYVLVVEKTNAVNDGNDDKRSLLVLTADSGGQLKVAKQNDKVVYCRSCGGVFGDPFAGLRVSKNSFTVDNYGGSNWRWGDSYKFNYSRIDKTWQLVLVEKDSFMATDPDRHKTRTFTPKKFGKVDIVDFDPDKIK